jgi:predicted transcriptional regulator
MLTGPLCAAARALIELSQSRLADKVGVAEKVLIQFESGELEPDSATVELIRNKLEEYGAIFIPDSETMGVGVRLKFSRSVVKRLAAFENEGGPARHDDIP